MRMEPSLLLANQLKVKMKSSSRSLCRTVVVESAMKIKRECSSFSEKYKALNH
jgi:hypothetical protein